jgi:hypothetical protein
MPSACGQTTNAGAPRPEPLKKKGNEYILPVRIDETELPGMPLTTGYVSTAQYSIEQIAGMVIKKLTG